MINDSRSQFRDTKTPAASGVTCCGWLEIKHSLAFPDDLGQTEPAAGAKFEVTTPTGEIIEGELDAEGFALIPGAGHGVANIEIEPHIDDEIQTLQAEIKIILDNVIAKEQKEYAVIERRLESQNLFENSIEYEAAKYKGMWNGLVGIGESAWNSAKALYALNKEVNKQINEYLLDPLNAPETFEKDVAEVKKQYQSVETFVTEDLKTYFILINDEQTRGMLTTFALNYIKAQHSLEITEAGGEVATGVILAILTAGAGTAVASGAAGARLATVAKNLSSLVKKLTKLLKRKRAKAGTRSETNRRVDTENELNSGIIGGKNTNISGETKSTVIGKNVHKKQANIRRESGNFDIVEQPIKAKNGETILVPKRVDLKTGKPQPGTPNQKAVPDAVSFKKELIIDDKPLGRPIAKDRQEIIRFIEAYKKREGKLPKRIAIQRYDPKTGKPVRTDLYSPEYFSPKLK